MARWPERLVAGLAALGLCGAILYAQTKVNNTAASLVNKTLVTQEDPQTVTGLYTYSRGTNAPFAVLSGSARVDNLNGQYLNGLTTPTQIPVLSGGNATTFTTTNATNITLPAGLATMLATTGSGSGLTFGTGAATLGGALSLSGAYLTFGPYATTITLQGATSIIWPTAGTILSASTRGATGGLATTGSYGFPNIVAYGRQTGLTGAATTIASYTVGGSDGTFEVSANVRPTTSTTHSFNVNCVYTDEASQSRTLLMNFTLVGSASQTVTISDGNGTVPYMGATSHIRAKAGTQIVFSTSGTFTTVTYNVEAIAKQLF